MFKKIQNRSPSCGHARWRQRTTFPSLAKHRRCGKERLKRKAMQVLFAPEVVVQQRLIDARGAGDGFGTGTVQPLLGKDLFGGSDDAFYGRGVPRPRDTAGQSFIVTGWSGRQRIA